MGCVKEKLDVVIADDNERILQLLNDILSNDDEIEVVGMARNGEEAVNVITTKQPDVVLVDIIMPKLDGLAVMDKVNKEAARSWLLLTTKNLALNLKRDRNREFLVEVVEGEAEIQLSKSVENPEEFYVRKMKNQQFAELEKGIFDALYEKNPRWYEAITITYVLEKPQNEAAENMKVTLEVLQAILYRAKQWIRKNYAEEYAHLDKA